jgi:hypothetical protein
MQPDKASAATAAIIGSRNARTIGTVAIPQSGDSISLAPVMVNKGFSRAGHDEIGVQHNATEMKHPPLAAGERWINDSINASLR